ncbi:hypothetical protein ACWFRB_11310 [Rhodococcus sp. NPDC055112]
MAPLQRPNPPGTSDWVEDGGRHPREALGRRRDVAWVVGVALLPLLLLVASLVAALIEDNRGTMIGDVLIIWNLYGIFGLVVFCR